MTLFTLAICSSLDETLVRVFTNEADLRKFAAANPPDIGHTQTGPVAEAYEVRGVDQPSQYLGYLATKVVDGAPVKSETFYWPSLDEQPWDPEAPLFPDSYVE